MTSNIVAYCFKCNKSLVNIKRKVQCNACCFWYHQKCTTLSIKEYNYYSKVNYPWTCSNCLSEIFPFHSIDSQLLIDLCVYNSNTICHCSRQIAYSKLDQLPCFSVMSSISNIPHLSDIDVVLQLPCQTNFDYYTPHDFHASDEIKNACNNKSFSVLHLNIRSLSANFDSLSTLLPDLHHNFSVIGLSETKIKSEAEPLININLPGYRFLP